MLSATVVTASGYPASGAIVRVSTNAGVSWIDIVTDVRGKFEHYIAAGSASVELIVLAHPSPTSIMTVSLSGKPAESISIQLAPQGGLLGVIHKEGTNRAILFQGQTRVPFGMLFPPGMPFGPFNGRAHLAPGQYRLCPGASAASVECKSTTVGPGTESIVDLTPTKEAEAHGGV